MVEDVIFYLSCFERAEQQLKKFEKNEKSC